MLTIKNVNEYENKLKYLTEGDKPIMVGDIAILSKLPNGNYLMYLTDHKDGDIAYRHTLVAEYSNIIGLNCSIDGLVGKRGTFSKYRTPGNHVWELRNKRGRVIVYPNGYYFPVRSNTFYKIDAKSKEPYVRHIGGLIFH